MPLLTNPYPLLANFFTCRGTTWAGLAHACDWYATLVQGALGAELPPNTGPRDPDSQNLWPVPPQAVWLLGI